MYRIMLKPRTNPYGEWEFVNDWDTREEARTTVVLYRANNQRWRTLDANFPRYCYKVVEVLPRRATRFTGSPYVRPTRP